MSESWDKELRRQFDSEIPLLKFAQPVAALSDDFIYRVMKEAPEKTTVASVFVRIGARVRNLFELIYLPRPMISVPLLLILGLLLAQADLRAENSGQDAFFGEIILGVRTLG